MKSTIIQTWCDACLVDNEDAMTPAEHTIIVSAVGQYRDLAASARSLDLCDVHYKMITDLEALIAERGARPDQSTYTQPTLPRATLASPQGTCPICDYEATRPTVVGHIWREHIGRERDEISTTCPNCGNTFGDTKSVGVHRVTAHGISSIDAAMEIYNAENKPKRTRKRS